MSTPPPTGYLLLPGVNTTPAEQCPRPRKLRFATMAAAQRVLTERQLLLGWDTDVRPYRCRCGWVHLGHATHRPLREGQTP